MKGVGTHRVSDKIGVRRAAQYICVPGYIMVLPDATLTLIKEGSASQSRPIDGQFCLGQALDPRKELGELRFREKRQRVIRSTLRDIGHGVRLAVVIELFLEIILHHRGITKFVKIDCDRDVIRSEERRVGEE